MRMSKKLRVDVHNPDEITVLYLEDFEITTDRPNVVNNGNIVSSDYTFITITGYIRKRGTGD